MKDSTDQELVAAKLAVNDDEKICENYEPLRVLGQGGMGQVILARHRFLGHLVAIKRIISGESLPDARICSRFLNEAKVAQRLKHPNVVQIHEFGVDAKGSPYAVMDYIEGETLASMLEREKQLTAARTASLCGQVAEGLAYAHQQGVIHRDIKPSNIIVQKIGEEERAVIVDFGLAKLVAGSEQELTKTGEVFGSPLYFSPEQALGQQVGPESDLYSLGCVLFECAFGHPPFHGDSPVQTAMMHVNAEIPIPASANTSIEPLAQVIRRCLQKSAVDRYSSAAELNSDLHAVVHGSPLKTHKTKRSFKPVIVIVLVALILLIGAKTLVDLKRVATINAPVSTTSSQADGYIDTSLFPPDRRYMRYISRSAQETVSRDMSDATSLSRQGNNSKAAYALRASATLLEEERTILAQQQLNHGENSREFKDLANAILLVEHYTAECYAIASDRFLDAKEYALAAKYYQKCIPWFTEHASYEKPNPYVDHYYQNYISVLNLLKDPSGAAKADAEYKKFLQDRDKKPSL